MSDAPSLRRVVPLLSVKAALSLKEPVRRRDRRFKTTHTAEVKPRSFHSTGFIYR